MMLRIKAIYRGRGIRTGGSGVYQTTQREQWLGQIPEAGMRQRAAWLYEQLDQVRKLRKQAKAGMLAESRHHRAIALLRSIPQLGPIRAAQIVATADTPYRFRTKRQFWSYSGLAVVTHSSAEYEFQDGRIRRRSKPVATRGLNRNCNRRLKSVFVSAAAAGSQSDPWSEYLESLKQKGMRPEMARLTLARKIATVALTIWKKGETLFPPRPRRAARQLRVKVGTSDQAHSQDHSSDPGPGGRRIRDRHDNPQSTGSGNPGGGGTSVPLPLVETMEAGYSNVTLSVFAEGTVAPRTVSELTPEVSGRVIDVAESLVVGGFFEKEDVLLRLDSRDYELAVTRSQAAIAQAKLRLETERQEAAVAMEEWELLGRGRPTPLAMREPQIAEALAALASAEAASQQAEYDLERTVVRAPFAGRVRQERVDVGQFVARGDSVATLYAVDAAEVRLPIPDSELAFLNLTLAYRDAEVAIGSVRGPRVILRSEFAGRRHEWRGTIVRTEGEIDPRTRMVHAIARVEDPYARGNDPNRPPLAVGMFVEAEIIGRSSGRVMVLPRTVLRGADRVLIVDDADHVRFRQVELFRLERDRILVKSGIEEGDRIIVSPLGERGRWHAGSSSSSRNPRRI